MAFNALIEALTSPPILALPVWTESLSLSTDASEIGAGAVLTQCIEGVEKVIACGSKMWSRGDSKKSATGRECMAVMWAVNKFQSYLWGRQFTLIANCPALTWLFKSQSLTPRYHRWALRLMEHEITLTWRPGTQHQLPDVMSRYKRNVIEDFSDSFPGDELLPNVYKGPQRPVLDGVHLETLGVEDVDGTSTQSLAVLAAVALTPVDTSVTHNQQAKLVIAPELPVVVMLDCGGGGSILASEGLMTVRGAVDQDWRALECIRANGLDNGTKFFRVTTGSQERLRMLREVRPDMVIGDACRRFERVREKEGVSGASNLSQAAIASDARVFILECLGNLLRTTEWNDEILPALEQVSYIVDKAKILASQVRIPWRRKRTFVLGIKEGFATKGKLAVWKRRLEKVKQPIQELGEFLGRRGAYFLKGGNGERAI